MAARTVATRAASLVECWVEKMAAPRVVQMVGAMADWMAEQSAAY